MTFQKTLLAALNTFQPRTDTAQKADQVELWIDVLEAKGIDLQIADMALKKVITESEFMPRPADVVRVIEGSEQEKAANAWGEVLRVFDMPDSQYRPIVFADNRISEAIVNLGGWVSFYDSILDCRFQGTPWARKNFIEAYQSCRGNKPAILKGRAIVGRKFDPLLIGDTEKCSRLLESKKQPSKVQALVQELV